MWNPSESSIQDYYTTYSELERKRRIKVVKSKKTRYDESYDKNRGKRKIKENNLTYEKY